MTCKLRNNAPCRQCRHIVHDMEMNTVVGCDILRVTQVLIVGGRSIISLLFFFFNDPATTEIYPLPQPDPLPIYPGYADRSPGGGAPDGVQPPRRGPRQTRGAATAAGAAARSDPQRGARGRRVPLLLVLPAGQIGRAHV